MVKQEEINEYFLEVIRFLKSEYGYTQEFIVEKAGLGKSAISKIKKGENNVGDKPISKLCDAFGMLNHEFFYGRSPYKTKREESEAKMEQALKEAQDACNENHPSNSGESLKDELIATLKSQMADLRFQLVEKDKRIEEMCDHISTLKRENENLSMQVTELRDNLSSIQQQQQLGRYPFKMGTAEQTIAEQQQI